MYVLELELEEKMYVMDHSGAELLSYNHSIVLVGKDL